MADVKISDLTAEAAPATTALVEVENAGASRKSTLAQIWTAIRATAKTYFDGIYATTAQGTTADTALQPGDIGVSVQAYDAQLDTWSGVTPGTGVATFLATPTSANLAAALTDETGTGAAVFATSPTLVTPLLGTPTSGTLTNCTGLPLAGLAQSSASSGQVAAWNGSAWAPTTPTGGASNTKWIGAGELIPRVTGGAGIDGEELATNDINLDYLAFDATTSEGAQVSFAWPSGFTTFTATFHWTAASGSGTVTWTAAARCYADDDALDQAHGTAQSVTDTLLAANDAHKSSATSAVTPGGMVAAGNLTVVQITRDVADTLAVDARLIGVLLEFSA